jgi:hypothetical protein
MRRRASSVAASRTSRGAWTGRPCHGGATCPAVSNMLQRPGAVLLALAAALALFAGCASRQQPGPDGVTRREDRHPAGPTSGPATVPAGQATFVEPKTGTRVEYPATWDRRPSTAYALLVTPRGADPSDAALSLDVPDLPPHVPGWIPIGLVRNGYADDIRSAHADARVTDLPPPAVPGASVRLVRAEWADARGPADELALIVVRGDHVMIVRGTSRPPHDAAKREAFDRAVASLAWPR